MEEDYSIIVHSCTELEYANIYDELNLKKYIGLPKTNSLVYAIEYKIKYTSYAYPKAIFEFTEHNDNGEFIKRYYKNGESKLLSELLKTDWNSCDSGGYWKKEN